MFGQHDRHYRARHLLRAAALRAGAPRIQAACGGRECKRGESLQVTQAASRPGMGAAPRFPALMRPKREWFPPDTFHMSTRTQRRESALLKISGLAVLLIALAFIPARSQTTEQLMPSCRSTVELADLKIPKPGQYNSLNGGYCLGVVDALTRVLALDGVVRKRLGICLPKSVDFALIMKAVDRFLDRNPDHRQGAFSGTVLITLREFWPCKKS